MENNSLREAFEAWGKRRGLDMEWHAAYYWQDATDTAWRAYQAAHNAQQAVIDRLMLEYCPNEMTPEQLKTWGDSQRRAEE